LLVEPAAVGRLPLASDEAGRFLGGAKYADAIKDGADADAGGPDADAEGPEADAGGTDADAGCADDDASAVEDEDVDGLDEAAVDVEVGGCTRTHPDAVC